ncbi:hypothetical protein FSST1_000158 [Fusarium sambucinum]
MPDSNMTDASSADSLTVTQKRLRNRLSQQAFRKRQSAYIKDLERRLEIKGNDENEQIAQLEHENRVLRKQLNTACRKIERIQINLKSLSNSIMSHVSHDSASNLPTPQENLPKDVSDRESDDENTHNNITMAVQNRSSTATDIIPSHIHERNDKIPGLQSIDNDEDLFSSILLDILPNEDDHYIEQSSSLDTRVQDGQAPVSLDLSCLPERLPNIRGLPGIWSHEYQMGPASYRVHSPSQDQVVRGLANTNSSFADHLQMIRSCLNMQWQKMNQGGPNMETMQVNLGLLLDNNELTWFSDKLYLSATVMLSHFHSLSRPAALVWYTATRFEHNVTYLLLWQLNRSRAIYSRLHANYRPSALQFSEEYPSNIDWCPFPTIRDKLILLHAANPCLDQIMCDIATAYTVEVDAESLVFGQTGQAFIRVWDLVCGLNAEDMADDLAQNGGFDPEFATGHVPFSLPAPDIESLFQPEYARVAFKALGLGDGIPRFKVDPSLFVQYPELYDAGADVMATGTAIAPSVQTKLPEPAFFPKHDTLAIYRNLAAWCVNGICRASSLEA